MFEGGECMITRSCKESRDAVREKLQRDEKYQFHIGDMKSLVSLYLRTQEDRIRMGNRNQVKGDGKTQQAENEFAKGKYPTSEDQKEFMKILLDKLMEYEKIITDRFGKILKEDKFYQEWLRYVPGVGPKMAMVCLAYFRPENVYYATSLVSYAGVAPGKDKRVKGEKCTYPPVLKARLLGVLAGSFVKSSSPYVIHYYRYKLGQLINETKKPLPPTGEKTPDYNVYRRTLSHIEKRSKRFLIKRFLIDYFLAFSKVFEMEAPLSYEEEHDMIHVGPDLFTFESFLYGNYTDDQKEKIKDEVAKARNKVKEYQLEHGWKKVEGEDEGDDDED